MEYWISSEEPVCAVRRETMKAMLLVKHGGPEMLNYGEAPDPTAGPGKVVIDIHAASVNAADYNGTSRGSSAWSERASPISPSGTPCWE
jgi:NADPH:quinone reductase-like Zn-dependent oxidoreductase